MPHYFFDVDDGSRPMRDDTGHEIDSREHLRCAAIAALADIAKDQLPDGDHSRFLVRVRNVADVYVFEASLTLDARWLDEA